MTKTDNKKNQGRFLDKRRALHRRIDRLETLVADFSRDMAQLKEQLQRDFAEHNQCKEWERLTREIFDCLNHPTNNTDAIREILWLVKKSTSLEAVGIRLAEGEDFPYYETQGFPLHFVEKERYLCMRDETGKIVRTSQGNPILECLCGNVLSGLTNPSFPFFTQGGSFFSNCTSDLLLTTLSKVSPTRFRNRCISEGYESLALIPLRIGEKTIGLVQLNDHRRNQFTPEMIRFFEGLGASIGVAYSRKQIEESRLELQQLLLHAQRLESLGELTCGLAHDFNNLLTIIITNLSCIKNETANISTVTDYWKNVDLALKRTTELIKQMLTYAGKAEAVVKPLDLSKMVKDMGELLKSSISKKANLRYDLMPDLPSVEGDARQLSQVLMNLIINASAALGDQPGEILITTGKIEVDGSDLYQHAESGPLALGCYVYLEVKDTGCGMDEEMQAKIFDPFFTTKIDGKGLGLAAMQGIVRNHKGTIKVKSQPGRGTSFTILLPASGKPVIVPEETSSPTKEYLLRGTILVVDDEEMIRSILKRVLSLWGLKVLEAANGMEALEIYRQHGQSIDCVLLDYKMPKMDGAETFFELSKIAPDLRVILSSGYAERETIKAYGDLHWAGFIEKPFETEQLKQILHEVLDR